MRVTLDRNGLVNLQEGTGEYSSLARLLELHESQAIRICIPAIVASERQRGGAILATYEEFDNFVSSLGLGNYEELMPMAYFDVANLDHCLLTEPDMEELERQIHKILFPSVEFDYAVYAAQLDLAPDPPFERKWLNAKCDVQAIWSHTYHRADIFVTEDRNFHKATKKPALIELNAGMIATPSEALVYVEGLRIRPATRR